MNQIEQIKAEIKRRIEQYDKQANAAAEKDLPNTLQANELAINLCNDILAFIESLEKGNIGQLGKDGPIVEFVDASESLEKEPLKGLDEVAEKKYQDPDVKKGTSVFANDEWREVEKLRNAFKNGVKWMAEQGVSMEITDETKWTDVDTFVHRNCDGAIVIQIRKKEKQL